MAHAKLIITAFFVMISFASCNHHAHHSPASRDDFIGRWVQPNPIDDKEVQGFELKEDGSAISINMETLKTRKWWLKDNYLVLEQESIGNGVSSTETTSYQFEFSDKQTLHLKNNELQETYSREVSP